MWFLINYNDKKNMKKFRNIFILFVVALVGVSLTSCNDEDLVTDPYNKSGVNLLAYGPSPILRNAHPAQY